MSTSDPKYSALERRLVAVEQLLRANPLRSASVRRGVTEWKDESTLLITNSNLSVVGTATVTGWLRVIGRIVLEGLGILTVNGLIELLGRMRVTGDIEILGGGKIKVGNVILEDGKIKAGGMTIDPDVSGGQIDFGDGRVINAGSGFLGVYDGDRFVVFNSSGITLNAGGRSITVGPGAIRGNGLTAITEADSGGHKPGAMYAGADGTWYRVVPD